MAETYDPTTLNIGNMIDTDRETAAAAELLDTTESVAETEPTPVVESVLTPEMRSEAQKFGQILYNGATVVGIREDYALVKREDYELAA